MKPFTLSLAGHGVILAALLVTTFLQACRTNKPKPEQIELFSLIADEEPVQEPAAVADPIPMPPPEKPDPEPEPEPPPPIPEPPKPAPIPDPELDALIQEKKKEPEKPKKVEKPKPEVKKPPEKKPIVPSNKIVQRPVPQQQKKPEPKPVPFDKTRKQVSQDDIRKALSSGTATASATPKGPTVSTSERARCQAIIKQALLSVWERPGQNDAGSRPAFIELTFDATGRVKSHKLASSSGSQIFDNSALAAAQKTKKINNLGADYLKAYNYKVLIDFTLEN